LIVALLLRVLRIAVVHVWTFLIAFLARTARILLLLLPRIGLTALLIFALRRVVRLVSHWSLFLFVAEHSVLAAWCKNGFTRTPFRTARMFQQ